MALTVCRFALLLFSAFVFSAESFAASTWQGKQRALVLLVEWSNRPAQVAKDEIENDVFSTNSRSLRQFFKENSAEAFDISGEVLDWKRSRQSWSQDGCSLSPIVSEAWRLFGSQVRIGNFDADRNGRIDNLFIIHSGRITHERVTPSCIFTRFSQADHTVVMQSQGSGPQGSRLAIGFYLHEAGHRYFNLHDLYGDHFHGRYGIGMWGIMGLGAWGVDNLTPNSDMFRFPAHFNPPSKLQIGWGHRIPIRGSRRDVALNPVELSGDIAVVQAPSGQKFYLEYRSANGFSRLHPGHGLLVWKGNKIIQADGRDDINHGTDLGRRPVIPIDENFGDDSDPFPGSLGITEFEDRREGVRLENIREQNAQMIFDVQFI